MVKHSETDQALQYPGGIKFADMTRSQKVVFTAKIAACIVTFGYAFPHAQFE
jgi:hypothetical protein